MDGLGRMPCGFLVVQLNLKALAEIASELLQPDWFGVLPARLLCLSPRWRVAVEEAAEFQVWMVGQDRKL